MLDRRRFAAATVLVRAAPAALAQDDSALVQRRHEVREVAQHPLSARYPVGPSAGSVVEHAAGDAVFGVFGIELRFAGGTKGKGVVVNHRTHRRLSCG